MPLNDYITNITPDGSRQGLILTKIDEKRLLPSGEIKRTEDLSQAEILSSDIIESEKIIFSDVSQIDEDGIPAQLGDFLDNLNSISTIDIAQGTGPFNSVQTMQLKQIPASRILTHVDPTRNFTFEIEFQNTLIRGNINGGLIPTYDALVDELNSLITSNGGGGTVSYATIDYTTGQHGLIFRSNTVGGQGQGGALGGTNSGSATVTITSRVSVRILFDYDYAINGLYGSTSASTSADGENAEVYVTMPMYDARSILTGLSPTEEYSFTLERLNIPVIDSNNQVTNGAVEGLEGNQRARVVRVMSPDVIRLDTLIVEINNVLAGDATLEFSTVLPNYGMLIMRSAETTILGLSISSADLFHAVEIPFELSSPISGGKNLYEVLRYTWRFDQREWTRVIPYEWLEFRLGVATESRGQLTSSGVVSSGVIIPEGEVEPLDTSFISTVDQELTVNATASGTQLNGPSGMTADGFERSILGIGLI